MRIDANVSQSDEEAVNGGLLGFNEARLGPSNMEDVRFVLRADDGSVVGGVLGACTDVSLDTFEFQARPFYEKLGYTIFGTLEGYPPGYRQYFLTKHL
jgi:hypothetical protein